MAIFLPPPVRSTCTAEPFSGSFRSTPAGVSRTGQTSAIPSLIQGTQAVRVKHHQPGHKGPVDKPLRNHEQRQVTQVVVYQFVKTVSTTGPQHQAHRNASHRNGYSGAEETTKEDIGKEITEVTPAFPEHNGVADQGRHHYRNQAIGREHY